MPPRGPDAPPRRRPDLRDGLAAAAFAAFAAWVTWPSVLHPASTVAAPVGYDVSSSIGKFGAMARDAATPLSGGRMEWVAWPDGILATPGLDAASILHSGAMWLVSLAAGPVVANTALSLTGVMLTGFVTYAFVRWLTGDARAGLVAGAAFAAFPHLLLTVRAAPAYSHMWLYVLPLWAMTLLVLRPGRDRAILAGASLLPAMFWTPYFTLHVLVEGLACGVVGSALIWRAHGARVAARTLATAAAVPLAGLAAYVAVGLATAFADAPGRPLEDAYQQAAHPLMFAVPGSIAWLWGPGPADALAEVVPRSAGTNLYLGVSVLALAALGAATALRRRPGGGGTPGRGAVAAALAAGTGAVAVLWSLPPTVSVAGIDLSLPARASFALAPGLRAGQRFVMPVMCAVVVLAGLGAARLLRDRRGLAAAAAAAALVALIAADLAIDPANRTARIPASAALEALRAAPDGPVIHYQRPDDGTTLLVGAVARPCVVQTVYRKPLVNGCNLPMAQATTDRLARIDTPGECATADALRALGVRYVLADAGVDAFPGCPGPELLARDERFTVLALRS